MFVGSFTGLMVYDGIKITLFFTKHRVSARYWGATVKLDAFERLHGEASGKDQAHVIVAHFIPVSSEDKAARRRRFTAACMKVQVPLS